MKRRNRVWGWRHLAALAVAGFPVLGWGATPPPRNGAPPRRHIVEVRGMAFEPAVLEVAPGDTVVWINRDIVPHTATAAGPGGWNTGALAQGQRALQVVRSKGSVPYWCEFHPTMRARLVVTAPPALERGLSR